MIKEIEITLSTDGHFGDYKLSLSGYQPGASDQTYSILLLFVKLMQLNQKFV